MLIFATPDRLLALILFMTIPFGNIPPALVTSVAGEQLVEQSGLTQVIIRATDLPTGSGRVTS